MLTGNHQEGLHHKGTPGSGGRYAFSWNCIVAEGHSGGTLIGVKQGEMEAMEMDCGKFYSSITIENKQERFRWEIVNVYGPVQDNRIVEFLQELFQKLQNLELPVVVGEDFNWISYSHEKSSDNINHNWMNMFNNFIEDCALSEVIRNGSRFTWTNKQNDPIRYALDRVLISQSWENRYPKAALKSLLRVGSDHNPLLLETETKVSQPYMFRFESMWLEQEGFRETIMSEMPERGDSEIQDF